MRNQHMFRTLVQLKGNPRVCVYTEPLWSIPYFLFMPFASVYMIALGVSEIGIGTILTIGMISQVFFSLLGGLITDKLGRKKTTFIYDMISWGIPTFIWAISQSYIYFAVAAAINGVWRVTANSWTCLLVEDAEEDKLVSIFSWIHITGLLAAFFSPLTGLFVEAYDLIPTIRVIYGIAFILVMTKFLILNKVGHETEQGIKRMNETKDTSYLQMLKGYRHVIAHILTTKKTLFVIIIMVVVTIVNTVNGSFWAVIVTGDFGISTSYIGIFTAIKSIVMMFFYLIVLPKINVHRFKVPLIFGFLMMLLAQLILILTGSIGIIWIIVSLIFEGVSLSLISPLLDSLQVVMIDKDERARIVAILFTVVILLTSPFGALAGYLSSVNQRLPFVMNMTLLVIGLVLVFFAKYSQSEDKGPA